MSPETLRAAAGVDAKRLHQLLVICAIGWAVFACNYLLLGRLRGVYIDLAIIVCTLLIRAWMIRQVASRALVAALLTAYILGPVGTRLLQRFGYQTDVVNDGEAAVAAATARHYDLILMDIRLPGIDGAEATRQIRKQREGRTQPRIIAMTANLIEDNQWLMDRGFDDYLGKPVDTEALRAILAGTPAMTISNANQ